MNFSALVAYRANLVNSIIGSTVWGTFHFISIILLTNKTRQIYGWKREEIIMLTATFSILWGIFHIIFSKNFQRMSRLMDLGQLDSFLLKPIDTQFLLSMSLVNFMGAFRLILGIVALYYIATLYHIPITFINIIGYITLLLCGLILIYSIWFTVLTLTIWFAGLSNLLDFLYNSSGIMRYPPDIFHSVKEYIVIFILPLLLIVSTPTKVLLHKVFLGDIIDLIFFTMVFFFISRSFWRFALRHYTSASG